VKLGDLLFSVSEVLYGFPFVKGLIVALPRDQVLQVSLPLSSRLDQLRVENFFDLILLLVVEDDWGWRWW